MENTATEEWKFKINPWITMAPVMLSIFMFALDETISNVALPYMAGTFSISHNESTWIITSYLVASGIVIPAVDFFSRLIGRKQYFILSIIIFTVASIMCGLSNSMPMMLISRIIQGIGGGGIMPIAQAIIFEIFPKEKLPKAMAVFGLGVVMAPILGPSVGGWITENWSWPFIYFINIPFGILCLYLTNLHVEEPPYSRKQANVKMDFSGFFFLALWILTLQVVLDKGNDADWFNAAWICRLFLLSCTAFVLFVYIQIKKSKHGDSLINLSILRNHNFLIGTLGQIVLMAVLMSSAAILPSMLQNLLGYTSFLSGLSMLPRGLGCLAASILSGILVVRLGIKPVAILGLITLAIGGLLFGEINTNIALADIALPNFVFGLGMVMAMVPLANISCATLPNEAQTNASGVQNLFKNVGAAIGTSIATTSITRFSQVHQMMMVKSLTDTNPSFMERVQAISSAFITSVDPSTAVYMAQGQIYRLLRQQSVLWGYVETFRYYAVAVILILPFIYFLNDTSKKDKQKKKL
ncbi:DHA2 family efflux MFS transporter permease subunit [bacterium]|nr:DHA2 family efflux MFS transporter permease subunit [bacterium]